MTKIKRIPLCDPWTADCSTCERFTACHLIPKKTKPDETYSPHTHFIRIPHTLLGMQHEEHCPRYIPPQAE